MTYSGRLWSPGRISGGYIPPLPGVIIPPPGGDAPLPVRWLNDAIFGGGVSRLQNALAYAETNETIVFINPGIHTLNPATLTTTKAHLRPWGLFAPSGGELISNNTSPVIRLISNHASFNLFLGVHVRGPGGGIRLETTPGGFYKDMRCILTIENTTGNGLLLLGNILGAEFWGRVRGNTGSGIRLSGDGFGVVKDIDLNSMWIAENLQHGVILENTNPATPGAPRHLRISGGHILINQQSGLLISNSTVGVTCRVASFESNCRGAAVPQVRLINAGGFQGISMAVGKALSQGSQATAVVGGLLANDPTTLINCVSGGVNSTPLLVYSGTNNTHVTLWGCVGGIQRNGGPPWTAHHCRGTNLINGLPLNLAGISTG